MAMPSKTTGPLIGLVVFVILFVLTAATSVYFLTEWNKSAATEAKAKRDLAAIVPPGYLDQDTGLQAQQAAQGEGKSLVEFLVSRNANLMSAVTGETAGDAMSLRAALKSLSRPDAVLCCFSASNVAAVARLIQGKCFIAADHDKPMPQFDGLGTGEHWARIAGKPYTMPPEPGDVNDMHMSAGIFAVQRLITDLIRRAR